MIKVREESEMAKQYLFDLTVKLYHSEQALVRLRGEGSISAPVEEVKEEDESTSFLTGVPLLTMPGHTGYLTFATYPKNPKKRTGA